MFLIAAAARAATPPCSGGKRRMRRSSSWISAHVAVATGTPQARAIVRRSSYSPGLNRTLTPRERTQSRRSRGLRPAPACGPPNLRCIIGHPPVSRVSQDGFKCESSRAVRPGHTQTRGQAQIWLSQRVFSTTLYTKTHAIEKLTSSLLSYNRANWT